MARIASLVAPTFPIELSDRVRVFRTGRGIDENNQYWTFRRSDIVFAPDNFQQLAEDPEGGFDLTRLRLPNGPWPHSGAVIGAADFDWVLDPITGGTKPIDGLGQAVVYDGIVTNRWEDVLAAQGADCPTMTVYGTDADGQSVLGIAHCGTRPVLAHIADNMVDAMVALGCMVSELVIDVGLGAGDNLYTYDFTDKERELFSGNGREDIFDGSEFRWRLTDEDRKLLQDTLRREVPQTHTLAVSSIILSDLFARGVQMRNVRMDWRSSIVDEDEQSYRRLGGTPKYALGITTARIR